MALDMKSIFENIVGEGWNPETGSVSDFTPTPDGEYTGVITAITHAEHDAGESISVTIEAEGADGSIETPRAMMYVSNTLEKDWEVQGAKRLIKTLSKLAIGIGIELDADDFEDLATLAEHLEDLIGEEASVKVETKFNKKKKKDNTNIEIIFNAVEYDFDEFEEDEESESDEEEVEEKPAKKPKSKKKPVVEEVEEDDEDEDEEEDEEDGEYTKEYLNGLKIKELRVILEDDFEIDSSDLKKKKELIDAILAEA